MRYIIFILLIFINSCKTNTSVFIEKINQIKVKEDNQAIYIAIISKIPLTEEHRYIGNKLIIKFSHIQKIENIQRFKSKYISKITSSYGRHYSQLVINFKILPKSLLIKDRPYGSLIILKKDLILESNPQNQSFANTNQNNISTMDVKKDNQVENEFFVKDKTDFSSKLSSSTEDTFNQRFLTSKYEPEPESEPKQIKKETPPPVIEAPKIIKVDEKIKKPKPRIRKFNFSGLPKTKISLAVSDTTLINIINILTLSENVKIRIDSRIENKKITINFENTPWNKVLQTIIKKNKFKIKKRGNILFIY